MNNYYRIVQVGVLVVQAHVDVTGVAGLAPAVCVRVARVRIRQTAVETHQNYHKHYTSHYHVFFCVSAHATFICLEISMIVFQEVAKSHQILARSES